MSGHSKWAGIKHKKAIVDARRGQVFTKVTRELTVAAREGGKDGVQLEEVRYEGYGPHGVAVMVDTLTDNRNRTVAGIRNAFTRSGGALGEANSVAWMFNQQGVISVEAGKRDPEELALELLDVVDVGEDGDVGVEGDEVVVTVAPSRFEEVRRTLEERGYPVDSAEVTMNPTTSVPLDASQARQVLRLLDGLEEHDDVQQVYANAEIPDDVLDAVS